MRWLLVRLSALVVGGLLTIGAGTLTITKPLECPVISFSFCARPAHDANAVNEIHQGEQRWRFFGRDRGRALSPVLSAARNSGAVIG